VRFLQHLLIRFGCNVVAIWAASLLVSGVGYGSFGTLIVAGAVFSVINELVKPVVELLALPLIVVTLGIVLFFVNMLMLALTAAIVGPFTIGGFWSLVEATLVVWLVNLALGPIESLSERRRRG
jgi:putative membrane protein